MNEPMTNEPGTLHPDQVEELRCLVGTVEDWLLHTCFEVGEDLGEFLTDLGWAGAEPEQLVTWLINDLGELALTLRRATAGTDDSHTDDQTPSP